MLCFCVTFARKIANLCCFLLDYFVSPFKVRENQVGYWFVDGQSYFRAVYDIIDMAQVITSSFIKSKVVGCW